MLAIYALAALPFFTGGAVISFAFTRLTARINVLYAADLLGAAAGCLALIPLLNRLGAPGVVLTAAGLSLGAAVCFAPPPHRRGDRHRGRGAVQSPGRRSGDRCSRSSMSWTQRATKATASSSASGTRSRGSPSTTAPHGDWSLSPRYAGRARRVAVHGHRLGRLDADPEGQRLDDAGLPALRADRARLSPGRAARTDSPRSSSARAAGATSSRRSSSARARWTASKSTRSSRAT